MAITIKNNTTKLQNLKNKVNALPDKEESTPTVLDQTTVSPADVLVNKTYYSADADGQPVKGTGEMNNLGAINVEVGLDGTGQDLRNGYIAGVNATFSEEVNDEIDTQADLIAQIKSVLNNKMAGSGGSSDEVLKGLIERSLTEIVIPEGTTEIGKYAFDNYHNLESVVIPNSVTNIGTNAFYYCTQLKNIVLPNSITTISGSVFSFCTLLTNIEIPNSVTGIGVNAFKGCTSLTKLTIPNNVTVIAASALQIGSSTNKATIRFEGTTPPSIQSSTFNASYLDKIEVPASAVDTYKTATNWSNFADYIVGY